MLNKDSVDIIWIAKGNTNISNDKTSREVLKHYYYEKYGPNDRELEAMHHLVKYAFYDLIDNHEKPSVLMRLYEDMDRLLDILGPDINIAERQIECMMSAMRLCNVRKNGEFINGFSAYYDFELQILEGSNND